MGKKTEQKGVKNTEKVEVLDKLALDYFNGNQDKNAGAKAERKAKEQLELEMVNYGETHVTKISDRMYLEMGFVNTEKEEIDPKVFFEKHPELFWELCNIPKTAVSGILGDKEVALCSRTVTQHEFKIVKHKSDPTK